MSSRGGGTEEAGESPKRSNEETSEGDPPASTDDPPEPPSPGLGSDVKPPSDPPESPAPLLQPGYPPLYAPHLTPQQGGGYYMAYQQAQVTPEPPSPAGGTVMYDAASFRQQQFLNSPFSGQAYAGGLPPPPLSPRTGMGGGSMGSLPPASPLFPRVAANSAGRLSPGNGAPASPAPYLSAMYQNYGGYGGNGGGSNTNSGSPEDTNAWSDRGPQNLYPQASPQLYGAGIARTASQRSYSFDEMLPPSALESSDHSNPAYSPYQAPQSTPAGVSGTLFAQQTWGAYGTPGDMYNAPPSPVQPRTTLPQMPNPHYGGAGGAGLRPSAPYGGHFYPATSPGPPIQTTPSNKGPDGANLFIFHIPNHFTNLDMYHLFCPYGNLLSVRIMVERDTGRSRGFGFVSYDNPESAAMAIKELNGFAIGNKRLKVQHKQIRAGEREQQQQQQHQMHSPPYHAEYGTAGAENPTPAHSGWYEEPKAAPQASPDDHQDENRYEAKEEDTGVDLHRSGLGNLDPLRNALPDITGQSKG